jgi:hypothetical protein
MLDLQHQYNNCTTTPHMKMCLTHWDPPSCEGLLCNCCDGVVQESNPGGESYLFRNMTVGKRQTFKNINVRERIKKFLKNNISI